MKTNCVVRNKIVVGNWKMNMINREAVAFAEELNKVDLKKAYKDGVVVGIAPTFTCLQDLRRVISDNVLVLAQNVHHEVKGAFTGEVSIDMLNAIDVNGSLVGHSERRLYNNETNASCNKKLTALLEDDMYTIYCVGETLQEYEKGASKRVVAKQLREGLANLSAKAVSHLVIAYEPVWSIGTGKNASMEIAEDMCKFIRQTVRKLYDKFTSDCILIQYGGSVKPENAYDYMSCPNIDGVLVGGASLKVDSFVKLIEAAAKAYKG